MNKENWYMFIGKVALEYRLSLKNICIILGIENNEKNRMEIYNTIMSRLDPKSSIASMYKYLFNYETTVESKEASEAALNKGVKFLRKYLYLNRTGNDEQRKQLLESLTQTERDFKELMDKKVTKPLIPEEVEIISKYRIKHCLSRMIVAEGLNVDRDSLARHEKELEDEILKDKIQKISEYFQDVSKSKYRR